MIASVLLLLLTTNITAAQSSNSADATVRDAIRRLDEALSVSISVSGSAQNLEQAQATKGGRQPAWVNNPYAAYDRNRYLAAVGFGANRSDAELKAFAALTAIFGQSVQSDFTLPQCIPRQ